MNSRDCAKQNYRIIDGLDDSWKNFRAVLQKISIPYTINAVKMCTDKVSALSRFLRLEKNKLLRAEVPKLVYSKEAVSPNLVLLKSPMNVSVSIGN